MLYYKYTIYIYLHKPNVMISCRRAGADQKKTNAILRLRAQLRSAVAAEDYEQAAKLRDQIKEWEGS